MRSAARAGRRGPLLAAAGLLRRSPPSRAPGPRSGPLEGAWNKEVPPADAGNGGRGGKPMTSRMRYVVACLCGHGVGPEVMAQASRALARVSRLHGFQVDEIHPPFGAGAVTQSGPALPTETRQATLAAQAILVAAGNAPP